MQNFTTTKSIACVHYKYICLVQSKRGKKAQQQQMKRALKIETNVTKSYRLLCVFVVVVVLLVLVLVVVAVVVVKSDNGTNYMCEYTVIIKSSNSSNNK